jgi:RNA polymerase sigma factor (sigma-70 family)
MADTMTEREFAELVHAHQSFFRGFAYKLTQSQDDAQDVLQDALVRAWRFRSRFEPGTNFRAWVSLIIKRSFLNIYRQGQQQGQHVSYSQEDREFILEVAVVVTPDHREEPYGDEISAALEKVPEDFRTILLLDQQHIPHYEICEQLGIPNGTVKSRLHRARNIMARELEAFARTRGYEILPGSRRPSTERKENNRMTAVGLAGIQAATRKKKEPMLWNTRQI